MSDSDEIVSLTPEPDGPLQQMATAGRASQPFADWRNEPLRSFDEAPAAELLRLIFASADALYPHHDAVSKRLCEARLVERLYRYEDGAPKFVGFAVSARGREVLER